MALFLLAACHSNLIVTETHFALSGTEKMLVLPFRNLTEEYGKEGIVRCPLSGTVFMAGEVMEGSEQRLTDQLIHILNNSTDFSLVFSNQPEAMSVFISYAESKFADRDFLVKAARKAKADIVLTGYIYRFRQRVGNQYAIQSPASVAFGLHLIKVEDGSNVWYAHFDETQSSLSENLFGLKQFFKRKAKWITAEEMAISGLEDMLKTLPHQ
jgi:hypothetical protein